MNFIYEILLDPEFCKTFMNNAMLTKEFNMIFSKSNHDVYDDIIEFSDDERYDSEYLYNRLEYLKLIMLEYNKYKLIYNE